MKIKDKLYQLKSLKKAVLAANFYNFETLSGILLASVRLKLPVILQLSESSIQYMGLDVASSMAKAAIREYGAEAWLHLDHGSTELMVRKCLDAGFDSVMIDASEKPIAENIEITGHVVEIASGMVHAWKRNLAMLQNLVRNRIMRASRSRMMHFISWKTRECIHLQYPLARHMVSTGRNPGWISDFLPQ